MGVGLSLNKSLSWLRPKGLCDSGVDTFRMVKFSEVEMSSSNQGQDQSQERESRIWQIVCLCLLGDFN